MFIVLKEQFAKSRGPQIYQNFTSHLQILSTTGMIWNMFYTENLQPWTDLWTCYLVLSVWYIWTDTCYGL